MLGYITIVSGPSRLKIINWFKGVVCQDLIRFFGRSEWKFFCQVQFVLQENRKAIMAQIVDILEQGEGRMRHII